MDTDVHRTPYIDWSYAATGQGIIWVSEHLEGVIHMPIRSSWNSGLQNCKTIHFYYLSGSICITLLRQP